MRQITLTLFILAFTFSAIAQKNQVDKQKKLMAHSHNDYEQKTPLFTAFHFGFNSIEIDIIRDGNKLRVTHDSIDLSNKLTIEELYFNPLEKLLETSDAQLWLLIDLKYYDEKTLELLHKIVSEKKIFFQNRKEKNRYNPLKIILSGDIPRKEIMANTKYEFFFIDGRPGDLQFNYDSSNMPLISVSFNQYSKFNGKGKINEEDLKKINQLIKEIHDQNKYIRFWKTADNKKMWRFLNQIGVDVIGVDHLKKYHKFSRKK